MKPHSSHLRSALSDHINSLKASVIKGGFLSFWLNQQRIIPSKIHHKGSIDSYMMHKLKYQNHAGIAWASLHIPYCGSMICASSNLVIYRSIFSYTKVAQLNKQKPPQTRILLIIRINILQSTHMPSPQCQVATVYVRFED